MEQPNRLRQSGVLRPMHAVIAFIATVALLSSSVSAAEGGEGKKSLAVVETNAELAPLSALVQARLTQKGLSLVERGELDRVLQEQELSAGGIVEPQALVKLGKLLRADGFVLLSLEEGGPPAAARPEGMPGPGGNLGPGGPEGPEAATAQKPEKAEKLVRIRLTETAHAVRLLDWFAGWNPEKAEEVSEQVAAKVLEVAPKVKLPAGQVIPVGIVDVHRVQLGEEYQWACRTFATMLAARLSKEPRIVVLEREDLRRMLEEKLLTQGEGAEFWRSGVLIEGYMQRRGKEGIDLKLQVKRASGQELPVPTISVDVNKLAEAVEKSADGVVEQATSAPVAAAWDRAKEAEEFFRQGELLRNHHRERVAFPALQAANALDADNVHFAMTLLNLSLGWDRTGQYVSDEEKVELAGRLVPLAGKAVDEMDGWDERAGDAWGLAYALVWYFRTPSSVATPRIVEVNRQNRRIAVEAFRRAQAKSNRDPTLDVTQLANREFTASSTPEEGVANVRKAFQRLVMPPTEGGEIASDDLRFQACFDLLPGAGLFSMGAPYHLADDGNTLAKGLLAYFMELADNKDPIVRFFGCIVVCTLCEEIPRFYAYGGGPTQVKARRQSAEALPKSIDRALYMSRAIEGYRDRLAEAPDLSNAVKQRAVRQLLSRVRRSYPREERIAALEAILEPHLAKGDVAGLVGLHTTLGLFMEADPAWGPVSPTIAKRYVSLAKRVKTVLQKEAGEPAVDWELSEANSCIASIENAWHKRLMELKRYPALFQKAEKPDEFDSLRRELAEILDAFPELATPEGPRPRVRMLLSAKEWPHSWNSFEDDWLHSRIESRDGMLWVLQTDRRDPTNGPKATVGLAGFDMKEDSLVALWQTTFKTGWGNSWLRQFAIGQEKSYWPVANLGLIEFPGSLARGRGFIEAPRILDRNNGLPPGDITSIAFQGGKLWVAYAHDGSGLGVYDPATEAFETIFCSDVRGNTPFQAGRTYELTNLAPIPGGLTFLAQGEGFTGLWRLDPTDHEVQRLLGITSMPMVNWGVEAWFANRNVLARLIPDSAKAEVILANRDGTREVEYWRKEGSWKLDMRPFVPEREQAVLPMDIDFTTAAVHGDEVWARYGKSRLIVLHRGKSLEEATVMDNDILEGGKVLNFFETPYGLIAAGEGSVGLIEETP